MTTKTITNKINKYFGYNQDLLPKSSNYFGGKGADGTFQQIINLIPPFQNYIEPFLGYGSVFRHILKKPGQEFFLNDIDREILSYWYKAELHKNKHPFRVEIHNQDYRDFFKLMEFLGYVLGPTTFIYFDPPYPLGTRKSGKQYKYEMTDKDHEKLLEFIDELTKNYRCKIAISTYDNDLYRDHLLYLGSCWNVHHFESITRQGKAIETVYFNYDRPKVLHDHRFLGNNAKEREKIKNSLKNTIRKIEEMPPAQKAAILNYFNPNGHAK